jgi:hypothetical protein
MHLGEVRDQAITHLDRWIADAADEDRGTLFVGVQHEAARYAEFLLKQSLAVHMRLGELDVALVLATVTDRTVVSVERLTLGQAVQAAQYLDSKKLLAGGRRILAKRDKQLLANISTYRNAFSHGRPHAVPSVDQLCSFLRAVRQLCNCRLVESAVAAESGRA